MVDVYRRTLPELAVPGKPLGRHVEHDERSRGYAVTAAPLSSLASVRHHRRVGIYDQGAPIRFRGVTYTTGLGSCTGNAMAGSLSTDPFRHRFHEPTAVRIYSAATSVDEFPGTFPPDDSGSSGLGVAKVALGRRWIGSYRHAFDIQSALTALATGPILLGVSWLEGFDVPGPDGRMVIAGKIRGGHELVADEIDVENRRVWITNSWRDDWGLAGRAWWSWDDLEQILDDDGDVTVPIP